MGIIKAASGSVSGVFADQWLETYSCDGFAQGILAIRGTKKTGERSANKKGEENVISDGSTIIVNAGQCALAIDKGQIIGCYDTPGEHIYHSDRSGSIFHKGGLKSVLKQSFDRFGYGGVAACYQIIMFVNTTEQMGHPFFVKVPINLTERHTGTSIDADLMVSGCFSFRITHPVTFYQKVCGNTTASVLISSVLPHISAELEGLLRTALGKVCRQGVSAYEISMSEGDIVDAVTQQINEQWKELRGFEIVSLGIESMALTKGDKNLLQSVEYARALTDPKLAAATLVGAQAQAMQDAARNIPNNIPSHIKIAVPNDPKS